MELAQKSHSFCETFSQARFIGLNFNMFNLKLKSYIIIIFYSNYFDERKIHQISHFVLILANKFVKKYIILISNIIQIDIDTKLPSR